jgi:hypothetical protein
MNAYRAEVLKTLKNSGVSVVEAGIMEIEQKLKILKSLDTKALIEKIQQYEEALEKAMTEEAAFKAQNHGFLGSGDCQEVKRILGQLAVQAPELNGAGKKLTVADKEAWLLRQRTENKELSDAISKQRQVVFLLDDHQIKVEMAKKRLDGARAVLALRTAQINFLAA